VKKDALMLQAEQERIDISHTEVQGEIKVGSWAGIKYNATAPIDTARKGKNDIIVISGKRKSSGGKSLDSHLMLEYGFANLSITSRDYMLSWGDTFHIAVPESEHISRVTFRSDDYMILEDLTIGVFSKKKFNVKLQKSIQKEFHSKKIVR
jgi:hypothetical protein